MIYLDKYGLFKLEIAISTNIYERILPCRTSVAYLYMFRRGELAYTVSRAERLANETTSAQVKRCRKPEPTLIQVEMYS